MCAAVRPDRWDGGPRGLRALGPARRDHRAVTADGDIAIVDGRPGRDGRPRRAPGAGPDPGRGPDQRRDRPPAGRRAADPSPRRARRPGAPTRRSDRLPERGMDPGAVLLALLGSANLVVAPRGLRAVRLAPSGRTPSPGPGRGAAVLRVKGTTKAPRRHDGRQPVGRGARSVAGRRAERRRGDPQRRRSPAPGRSASRTASTTATRPGPRRSGS